MAGIIAKIKLWMNTPVGKVIQTAIYVTLVILILIYFDGKGEFIYEGF